MARKQFVSSKKNAPSRAVSSKEAALHGRAVDASGGGDNSGAEDDGDDVDGDESTGSDTAESPASSNGSSLLTSDDEDELDPQGNGGGDVDTSSETPVAAVEVMPSSVGRGKQLRFPTVISRGKESRVFTQDGGSQGDDDNDSDSDSLLSIASDEEEEDDKISVDGSSLQPQEDATMLDEGEVVTAKECESAPEYPIKGFRARKRHRPDSGYYKQMSTYVRDCLLSVRDGAESADVFTEESHDEFRRKLSAGTVERVAWKEASPPVDEGVAPVVTTTTKISVPSSDKKKEEPSVGQVKKEKHRKEHRTKEKRSESSGGSKSSSSNRKREEAAAVTSSKPKDVMPEATKKSMPEVKREEVKKEVKREEKSVAVTQSVKAEPAESARKVKVESSSSGSSSSKSTITSSSSSASNGAASAAAKAAAEKGKTSEALCSSCKRKLSDDKPEPEKPPPAPKKTVTIAPEAKADPVATFLIPTATGKDVARLRADASRLNEEARALKHEGNRKGSAEPGAAGQIAQGKCYLRSSAKFFQHALKLADIKAAYKELNDERHARTYGEYCVTTLSQTSSLIESTIRTFQNAGSTRMVALGYKLASIVHLTIYRLQHLKLFSLYTDLFTPGRSPDTRQNGTPTPPIGGSNPDSKEAAVRSHLLKEMEHTLRGFEMWRRYESCKVVVLPRITNPAITDLTVLFEDLHSELGSS
ncbi:hypothetical protein Gpo141_00007064 [Globisporangium polare]